MSFSLEKKKLGREPLSIVEIDLDFCALSFADGTCQAIGEACFNTLKTCKDEVNYTKSIKTYKMITKASNVPLGETMFPCITSISYSPTKLTFGEGLAYRSKVDITLEDFNHHDRGIDPYQAQRKYNTSMGTFFGKLLARNVYYNGRTIRIKTGYATIPFSLDNFDTREYVIDKISVSNDGKISITGLDILKKIDNKRSQCPAASNGLLLNDLTQTDTSLTLSPTDVGNEYPSSGVIRIGKEIMSYSSKSSDTLSGLTRGGFGTTAESGSKDDSVQICKIYDNENVVDIINDLLVNYANIDTNFIPYSNDTNNPDEWDTEKERWLALKNYYTVISKPTGVQDLIEEITEQTLILFWWDELGQKIKLKVIAPPQQGEIVKAVNDEFHILKNSLSLKNDDKKRYSEVWIYSVPKNWTNTKDEEDFSTLFIKADLNKESENQYGDKRVKIIKSRWYATQSHATVFADRFMRINADTPKIITLKVDAKDGDIKTGEFLDVATRLILDEKGRNLEDRYHVTEVKESKLGQEYQITCMTSGVSITTHYAYVAPNDAPDYSSATDSQKTTMAFISQNDGFFADGEPAYTII